MTAQRRGRRAPGSTTDAAEGWQSAVARQAAADAGGVDPDLLGDFLDRLAASGRDHAWDRHADATFAAFGAKAAEQGVVLRALVDLYLSAAWRAWQELPDVRTGDPAGLRDAGLRVLRTCDDVVAALAEGYNAAGRGLIRRETALRREFVDDLLAGTADPSRLLALAESYGLQLAGTHVVLVAAAATPWHEASPVLAEVTSALTPRQALVTTRDGELVVVLPAAARPDLDAATRAVRRAVTAAQPSTRMALGRGHTGPSGVARSFTEARDALGLAANLGLTDDVVRAEDLLVYQVLLRDRAALIDLVDTVLTPLRSARGGAGPLLDTLQAYVDSGGNTTRTAQSQHLSVRAVSYRLARVAALTGMHPNNPAHRFTLHTAILGARVLGWPDGVTRPGTP
ncbi:MAG TPA: helix-turn-helix domain-containing protein [Pseudonocardiaceae bacterium]|nr:helix-turn-helix domain-containing protein [Pseudonocardiaceae bacterium]